MISKYAEEEYYDPLSEMIIDQVTDTDSPLNDQNQEEKLLGVVTAPPMLVLVHAGNGHRHICSTEQREQGAKLPQWALMPQPSLINHGKCPYSQWAN